MLYCFVLFNQSILLSKLKCLWVVIAVIKKLICKTKKRSTYLIHATEEDRSYLLITFTGALNSEAALAVIDVFPDGHSDHGDADIHNADEDNDEDDDYLDDIAIAALKPKRKRIRRKEITEQEAEAFSQILKKPNLKVKDFVKYVKY